MKKLVVLASFMCVSITLFAQVKNEKDWVNEDPQSGTYGVSADKVHQYVLDKKLKVKTAPIVAIISGGIDAEHEALKKQMWVNKKEKADGKDNDKNGFIDDINGWNFIGGKDGSVLTNGMYEGDREYFRLRKKYEGYFFDGKRYFKYNEGDIKRHYVDAPADMEEYNYYSRQVIPESRIGGSYGGYLLSYVLREYVHFFNDKLKTLYPDKTSFTETDFISCWDRNAPEQDSLQNLSMAVMGMAFNTMQTTDWAPIFDQYSADKQFKLCYPSYESEKNKNDNNGERERVVGDNYLDINDNKYGNNTLLTPNSATATVAAGIITGQRGVENRNNPISTNAKIMALSVSPEKGELILKDVALSIRYAVDNGASIILLESQNTLYPREQKEWVTAAIEYAESKDVLVIVPTSNYSYDLSVNTLYPNRFMGKKELSNLMVVSASDRKGNPLLKSNYSNKFVDLYAPGAEMMTTYIGDTYMTVNSATLSGATTAGVAALIKTYFPTLTGAQIRQILIENCTSRKGVEVEKGFILKGQAVQDIYLFDDLCVSGGILNAYNAFIAAEKLSKIK